MEEIRNSLVPSGIPRHWPILAPDEKYVDPISVLFYAALYNFEPDGTRWSVSNHGITCHPPGMSQSLTRTFSNWAATLSGQTPGACWLAVQGLAPAIIVALNDLKDNELTHVLWALAYRGFQKKINSYAGKPEAVQGLTTTVQGPFRDVFSKGEVNPLVYGLNDVELKSSKLNITSVQYWNQPGVFEATHGELIDILSASLTNKPTTQLIVNFTEKRLVPLANVLAKTVPMGDAQDPLSLPFFKEDFQKQTFKHQNILNSHFWKWYQKAFTPVNKNNLNFLNYDLDWAAQLKISGLPIDGLDDQNFSQHPQERLMGYLGLAKVAVAVEGGHEPKDIQFSPKSLPMSVSNGAEHQKKPESAHTWSPAPIRFSGQINPPLSSTFSQLVVGSPPKKVISGKKLMEDQLKKTRRNVQIVEKVKDE